MFFNCFFIELFSYISYILHIVCEDFVNLIFITQLLHYSNKNDTKPENRVKKIIYEIGKIYSYKKKNHIKVQK